MIKLIQRQKQGLRFGLIFTLLLAGVSSGPDDLKNNGLEWPPLPRESRPGAYWWWLGSAVEPANLTRELERYRDAGMGWLHIIPIYGAKGWEPHFIPYLSPRWMEVLHHTVREASRLDLGIDMTTGTGWCFGGPFVTDQEANAKVVVEKFRLQPLARLSQKFNSTNTQALLAFGTDGQSLDLTRRIGADGLVDWTPESGPWEIYAVSQKPSGQRVKRAAPGGEGHMLNLIYAEGVKRYLQRFDEAFARAPGPKPRAMYHDSYEYRSDWAPDFLGQFAKLRGYRLEAEFPALFDDQPSERAARVKCDYRETVSDILIDQSLPLWTEWCRGQGFQTRNQAHGSPGNLLDLYALVDIPETEMFNKDRSQLISKLASSAAHVTGRRLVASETGTWLKEHFTETLADMKYLLDELFVSGVNHVFYHGTCYSPDEAGWPGWLFYASFEMNPRNSVWRDASALNRYVSRCQAILQQGRPDNDILLYWPIHEFWQTARGLVQPMTVHSRAWLEGQPIGQTAERLWKRGFAFDYVSDRQLRTVTAVSGQLQTPGGNYRVVVVPRCQLLPQNTLEQLLKLATQGATVIFEERLPQDVPGWGNLAERRRAFHDLLQRVALTNSNHPRLSEAALGKGRLLVGDLEVALAQASVKREPMVDHPGLSFIRRAFEGGRHYFVANRSEKPFQGWLPLETAAQSVAVMDPMIGVTGWGDLQKQSGSGTSVFLQLQPGASAILRAFTNQASEGRQWLNLQPGGNSVELRGTWQVRFISGGPELPEAFQTNQLGSWTTRGDTNAQRFAGTALYQLTFDAPNPNADRWFLNLGRVCQSARVRLNGRAMGTLLAPPFQVLIENLKANKNLLEIEVTNVSANRIRDLDRRGVPWRNFHDINFVNLEYKPFDASQWPLFDSGLLGPVTLAEAVPCDLGR